MNIDIDEINKRNAALGDIEVPAWVGKLLRFSYLGFGLFLLASSLALLGCSSAVAVDSELEWQSATEVVSEARVREIAIENSAYAESDQENVDSLTSAMLVSQLSEEILIVDFNSPLLTGRAGTLFAVYEGNGMGDLILARYFNKRIPQGVPVIQLSERTGIDDYPCFVVNDIEQPTDSTDIVQATLCYDGAEWNTVEQKIVSVSSFE